MGKLNQTSESPGAEQAGRAKRAEARAAPLFSRFISQYGMLGVLIILGGLFSLLTLQEQHPTGEAGAKALMGELRPKLDRRDAHIVAARAGEQDLRFTRAAAFQLEQSHIRPAAVVNGDPSELRAALAGLPEPLPARIVVATDHSFAPVVRTVASSLPRLARCEIRVFTPPSHRWPTFLLPENLLNVANQIAVIAILAVGMTMVIITGGIDLSVGSLIALAAVVTAGLIKNLGGEGASAGAMCAAAGAAIVVCGLIGAFSGAVITRFAVPPFIATLGMMQVASGVAYILARGRPIYQVPESFVALGRASDPWLGVPYAVLLMVVIYIAAHLLMARTVLGRYIYAVGGNAEAARLAGVRVKAVQMFVYITCGLLAGLGGVIMASQLKSGAPTYGLMYELYVIAAVVVGGTSLSGGEGRILGTLIGAFIIAVIQNGMNLTNVESYTQKVVLGLVILGAVLLDRLKHRSWWQRARARGGGRR